MTERVLYQDVIPYEMPSSLAALHGPTEGVITLPLTVYWGPDATADLSTPDGVEKVYENLIREGTNDVRAIVSRVYQGLDDRLVKAACLSVLAHVEHLISKGLVRAEHPLSFDRPLAAV